MIGQTVRKYIAHVTLSVAKGLETRFFTEFTLNGVNVFRMTRGNL
jgi:hypothetical protein